MQEFFNNLYNIENFTLYLIIAIVVLVVLFLLVLFLGKKDQKIEETKKLEKLALEKAFKEEKNEVKVETEVKPEPVKKAENVDILLPPIPKTLPVTEEKKEDAELSDTIIMPAFEPVSETKLEEKPVEIKEENVEVTTFDEKKPVEVEEEKIIEPVVVTEEKQIEPVTKKIEEKVQEVVNEVEEEIKLPELNFDEVMDIFENKEEEKKPAFKSSEIFSSVYAAKKPEEEKIEEVSEELKPTKTGIDLPKKKVKSVEEKPFDINSISGETYNIDK